MEMGISYNIRTGMGRHGNGLLGSGKEWDSEKPFSAIFSPAYREAEIRSRITIA